MLQLSIEGNPFIIRFKTIHDMKCNPKTYSIEGNPFIIRFKTAEILASGKFMESTVLKVIHL